MGIPATVSLSSVSSHTLPIVGSRGSEFSSGSNPANQPFREMDPSKPKHSSPPIVEESKDDSSQSVSKASAMGGTASGKNDKDPNDDGRLDTIPADRVSDKTIVDKDATATSSVQISKPPPPPLDDVDKQVNFENTVDAIADIAARSQFRSSTRGQKRERSKISTIVSPMNNVNDGSVISNGSNRLPAMPVLSRPPTIVTASMSNHYVPPKIQTFHRKNDPSFFESSKSKVSIHMLKSVGLECEADGMLRIHEEGDGDENNAVSKDDDANNSTTADGSKDSIPQQQKEIEPPPTWTLEQHRAFAAAIFEIGLKNCSPSIIMENMRKQPKYITRERTKSHLQKYRQTKERSKGEFIKEFDAFFKATEEAKELLQRKTTSGENEDQDETNDCKGENDKENKREPDPKAVLTTALGGKKPNKLLSGRAAALLSYSVLNGFSTSYGPTQMQYKAAKLTEFPSLTEAETRTSVGASLLQVRSLIDNMTDILLKNRHGIKPTKGKSSKFGIGDDESVSSSDCSSDEDESSDEEKDNSNESSKPERGKSNSSKDSKPLVAVAKQPGGPFLSIPGHPIYGGPAYPAPYPAAQVAAPPAAAVAAAGFPPPQYPPHAQPPFFGGAAPPSHPPHLQASTGYVPPPTATTGYVDSAGFHHPPAQHPAPHAMHYPPPDPRMNPYQHLQAPAPVQLGSYTGVVPSATQPSYYPVAAATASYPSAAYYGGNTEGNVKPETAPTPAKSGSEYYSQHHAYNTTSQHQSSQQILPNTPVSDSRVDSDGSAERSSRRSRHSKRRRRRDDHHRTSSLTVDTSDFGEFLDRVGKIQSPSKGSHQKQPLSSPHSHGMMQLEPSPDQQQQQKHHAHHHHSMQQQGQQSYHQFDTSPHRDTTSRGQHQQYWESANITEPGFDNQLQPAGLDPYISESDAHTPRHYEDAT